MKKVVLKAVFWLIIIAGVAVAVYLLPMGNLIYSEQSLSTSNAVMESFEKQGKLQVIKMYLEQVHKEETVRELFGFDLLAPDSRTLVTFTSVATACVDLAAVKAEDIEFVDETIKIKLPKPELCDDPYIVPDTFTVYDQNWVAMLLDPQQEVVAQQKAIGFAREKALNNEILDLAETQAESVIENLLSVVTEKEIQLEF